MYPNIKNFITTKYTRKELGYLKNFYPSADNAFLDNWNNLHERLHRHLEYQLKYFYPESHLHIITNENKLNTKKKTYYKFDFDDNHLIKLFMYGLLSEPAMYLDSDIILFRKFTEEELPKENDFNLYNYVNIDLEKLISMKLPISIKKLYNAGIVYISNPNKKTTNDLFSILENNFTPKNCHITDEVCVSYFIGNKNIKMLEINEINIQKSLCIKNFYEKQSVHYSGFYMQHKLMYFADFKHTPTYKNYKHCI